MTAGKWDPCPGCWFCDPTAPRRTATRTWQTLVWGTWWVVDKAATGVDRALSRVLLNRRAR